MTDIMYRNLINGRFKVLNCVYSDKYITILICKDIINNYKYILNCIKDKSNYEIQIKSMLEYYEQNTMIANESKDFLHFVEANVLIIGFKYNEGQKLEHYLQNSEHSHEDIFKMIENILISIQVIKIPEELKIYLYDIDNIYINSNEEVCFNIDLNKKHSEKVIYQNEQKMIGDLIEKIVTNVMDNDLNSMLNVIKQKCKLELYESIPQLIYDVKSTFANIKEERKVHILNKEKLQKFLKRVFKILGFSVIGIVILYLGYEYIYMKNKEAFNQDYIKKIGDVSIEEFKVKSDQDKEDGLVDIQEIDLNKNENRECDDVPDKLIQKVEEVVDINGTESQVETKNQSKYDEYVVKKGEHLYQIVRDYYGSDDFVKEIIEFNNLSQPNSLKPGDILKLPKVIDIE